MDALAVTNGVAFDKREPQTSGEEIRSPRRSLPDFADSMAGEWMKREKPRANADKRCRTGVGPTVLQLCLAFPFLEPPEVVIVSMETTSKDQLSSRKSSFSIGHFGRWFYLV